MIRLFFILIAFFYFFSVHANTISVCPNCEINSLQIAIQKASPQDTIEIQKGKYISSKSIIVDKPLTIRGVDFPILDGNFKEHVIYVKSDNVTITGLEIINSGVSDITELSGILVENSKNCKILDNKLHNNTYGIYFSKSTNCIVKNNTIIGNAVDEVKGGNGIHLWSSNNHEITDNLITHHRDGFYFEFAENLLIERNQSKESVRYGMHFMFSHNNKFYNNRFYNNPTGVAIMYSRNIDVQNNRFEKNWGMNSYGVLLKEIMRSKFEHNVFKDNTIGIYAEGSNGNIFRHNLISNNGWGMSILGNNDDNIFEYNNFIGNVFDLSTNSRDNHNSYNENFWDKYTGYDLDKNQIGDRPHHPVQLFSFWVSRYSFLMVLLHSPVIELLEIAERAFPILTPSELNDKNPKMKRFQL